MDDPQEPIPAETNASDTDASAELLKWELWARLELDKGREPNAILAEMVVKGFPSAEADELVTRVRNRQALDLETAALEREEWRSSMTRYRRNVIIGSIYLIGGIAVVIRGWLYPGTIGMIVGLIAAAAVAFGLLRISYGLLGFVRRTSIRLDGRYVPGRRIGSYSPGTPRSRYSRFT